MEEKTTPKNTPGTYIFVSYSHDDLEKVRRIRDYLESRNIEPILFYLHCMRSEEPAVRDALWTLIRKEIDARDWFLYLDSENARKSEWVRRELRYAEETREGSIIRVDLDRPEEIQAKIELLSRAMRVYLSYAETDRLLAARLIDEFEKQDFQVITDRQADSREEIRRRISAICADGCFVSLLTPAAMNRVFMRKELEYAVWEARAFVYAVTADGPPDRLPSQRPYPVTEQFLAHPKIRTVRMDSDIAETVRTIRKDLVRRIIE